MVGPDGATGGDGAGRRVRSELPRLARGGGDATAPVLGGGGGGGRPVLPLGLVCDGDVLRRARAEAGLVAVVCPASGGGGTGGGGIGGAPARAASAERDRCPGRRPAPCLFAYSTRASSTWAYTW